jgi:uncharacterized protein
MKYIVLLLIVGVVLWLMFGRGRRERVQRDERRASSGPQAMLACAHCGVHLPAGDAQFDAEQRAYCSEAHRIAGPRRSG